MKWQETTIYERINKANIFSELETTLKRCCFNNRCARPTIIGSLTFNSFQSNNVNWEAFTSDIFIIKIIKVSRQTLVEGCFVS